jgi:DNA polymerase III delta subunit
LEDRWISAKSVAEQLGISREQIGSILEDLDMRNLFAKWVLKSLNADHKRQWCQLSEQLLEFFRRDPNDFLLRLVTMDETWLYHCDLET